MTMRLTKRARSRKVVGVTIRDKAGGVTPNMKMGLNDVASFLDVDVHSIMRSIVYTDVHYAEKNGLKYEIRRW